MGSRSSTRTHQHAPNSWMCIAIVVLPVLMLRETQSKLDDIQQNSRSEVGRLQDELKAAKKSNADV